MMNGKKTVDLDVEISDEDIESIMLECENMMLEEELKYGAFDDGDTDILDMPDSIISLDDYLIEEESLYDALDDADYINDVFRGFE